MQRDESSRTELFRLLGNERRRYALHACKGSERPLSLSDLAEQVAAWEYGKAIEDVTPEERRRVYTSMQQTHLPAMAEADVLEVEDKRVALGDRARELDIYLEVVPEDSISWSQYYLGLSLVAAGVLGAAWLGVYPDWIPGLAWAALIVLAFGLSATVHAWRERESRLGAGGRPPEIDGE